MQVATLTGNTAGMEQPWIIMSCISKSTENANIYIKYTNIESHL